MKKNTTKMTIGIDLGDTMSQICILDSDSEKVWEGSIRTTATRFTKFFAPYHQSTAAIEAGTHSPWVSHLLSSMGLKVYVANPFKVTAIWKTHYKSDKRDALILAQIAQFNPSFLHPITHRNEDAQLDLAIIKSRDALVRARTAWVNHIRGSVKQFGLRVKASSTEAFPKRFMENLEDFPEPLIPALLPIVKLIDQLTQQIRVYDKQIERLCNTKYTETLSVRQIQGVGPVTALAFVLTFESPERFPDRRRAGSFLGLTPRRDQSGSSDKQLRISKHGNPYLRRLLVACAQYILGPHARESDLRTYGERIFKRGGKNAKRRAVVAVARKLSVLMLALWATGEVYDPLRHSKKAA